MTNTAEPNADQIAYWNDTAGDTWSKMQADLDRQIEPLGLVAIEALAPAAGERIIDIGCGCGQTTLQLAARVGPAGGVLAVDVSQPMLAVARQRAEAAGVKQVRFMEADAQTHRFDAAAADAAFSRFGVMFFADTTAAFANVRRALKPDGRLAFVCWRTMAENPWMTVPLQAALSLLPAPSPSDPLAPGPFALADPDRIRRVLGEAGFIGVEITPHDQAIGGGELEQAVQLALRVGPLGALRRDYPESREAVADAVRKALAPYVTPTGVRLASGTWIVTARNA